MPGPPTPARAGSLPWGTLVRRGSPFLWKRSAVSWLVALVWLSKDSLEEQVGTGARRPQTAPEGTAHPGAIPAPSPENLEQPLRADFRGPEAQL